jgi:hypothetical protein
MSSIESLKIQYKQVHSALRRIGLALNASHNCITTDDPGAKESETSWRIDNTQEIEDIEYLENILSSLLAQK